MKVECKVTSLTKEDISNILSMALNNSYWAQVDNTTEAYKQAEGYCIEDKLAYLLYNGKSINIIDTEDNNKSYLIDLHIFKQALNRYFTEGGDININEWYFDDANEVLLYMCLGKLDMDNKR